MHNKRNIFFVVLLLLIFFGRIQADNKSIIVVLSVSKGPLKAIVAGMGEYLKERKIDCKITDTVITSENSVILFSSIMKTKPDAVFLIGEKTLDFASKLPAKGIPVISCSVSTEYNERLKIPGITLTIPVSLNIKKIKEVLPNVKTIGTICSQNSETYAEELDVACKNAGLRFVKKKVKLKSEFMAALGELYAEKIDCFFVVPDASICDSQTMKFLLLMSLKQKVSVIGLSKFFTKAGAILSIECDYNDLGKQAGMIAELIFNGKTYDDIGVKIPRKVSYSLNLSVAEKIGIKLSPGIIKDAEEVFQ